MSIRIRTMQPDDRTAVAALIYHSTNAWYEAHARPAVFTGETDNACLFYDVYHALPGSGGVVAVEEGDGLLGSCFYHVRPTHVSLGIMNVAPGHFGKGVARRLLGHITDLADGEGKPVRLVASAMNLDSYSLYTRAGFVPRAAYQDMYVPVPEDGIDIPSNVIDSVRPATPSDVRSIVALEMQISGINRETDWRHFIANREGIWHVSVCYGDIGLGGALASCGHVCSNMIGPGFARDEDVAAALLAAELNEHRGRQPVSLVPVECKDLVARLYGIGARNCELHFTQVRGEFQPFTGVNFPTFMPETG